MSIALYEVLLVEDERDLAELLAKQLSLIGCSVTLAHDGEDGLQKALLLKPHLIILDVSLPKLDGFTVCKKIREQYPAQPILILTSRSEEIDAVTSFDSGADDYVSKPFRLAELIARIKSLLRRGDIQSTSLGAEILTCNELQIDARRRRVLLAGDEVELTYKEFDLLFVLASNPGTVFSREHLLRLVWEDESGVYLFSVNSMIARLRKKIEKDSANPVYILTVRGVGYAFAQE